MPEIPTRRSADINHAFFNRRSLEPGDPIGTAGLKYIGHGREKFVFSDPAKPNKALAIKRRFLPENGTKIKQIFYLHRIFPILFPHNFPVIHAVFSKSITGLFTRYNGSIHQLIPSSDTIIKFPFTAVGEVCSSWKIPLTIESKYFNFIIGPDGGEYYIDTIYRPRKKSDLDSIPAYMQQNNYPEQEQNRVKTYIKRYKEL